MEPTTVLTLVSTANSVAGLFGARGSSAARMQQIEIEMLLAITKQIAVIQKGIDTILSRLEELGKLVGSIPEATVTTLYKTKGYGLVSLFQEHMYGFVTQRDSTGLESALKIYAPLLEREILLPLRDVRHVLMLQDSPVLIPAVSTMLHTEVHAMLVCNYERSRLDAALKTYESWLARIVTPGSGTLVKSIVAGMTRFAELKTDSNKLDFAKLCVVKSGKQNVGYNGRRHTMHWAVFKYLTVDYRTTYALSSQELEGTSNIYPAILSDSYPLSLVHTPTEVEFGVQVGAGHSHSQRPDLVPPERLTEILPKTENYTADSAKHPNASRLGADLEMTGFSLLSNAALLVAGEHTLNGLRAFQKELTNA